MKRVLIKLTMVMLFGAGCGDCPPCPSIDDTAKEKSASLADQKVINEGEGTDELEVEPGNTPKKVTSFDLHGRAGFNRVSIWSKPDMESPRLGYLKKGQRMMVGNPEYTTEGCPKGWFVLENGGYVCQGRGMLVGTKPRYIPKAPPPPMVDELDPYKHGFIRRDFTPLYKRLPAEEEMWKPPTRYVAGIYTAMIPDPDAPAEAAAPSVPATGEEGAAAAEDGAAPVQRGTTVEIVVDAEGKLQLPDGVKFEKDDDGEYILPTGVVIPREEIPHADPDKKDDESVEEDAESVPGIDYYRYAKRNFSGIRQFLLRGFWISSAKRFRDDNTRQFYYRTIKGDYVPERAVHMVKPPSYHGYRVLGDTPLPAVIVRSNHAAFYQARNSRFRGIGPVDRLMAYRVYDSVKQGASTYYEIDHNRYLKSSQVAYFELRTPPEGIGENDKWIYVDLSQQTLEAYEGTTPIFVTLISSGLPDSEETVTPTGEFEITFKHLTDDMTGSVGDGDEVYQVADVSWVQYIHKNIALHGAFWHSKYGQPKSHGCINLSPADARYLFNWSAPHLPEGWHGVASNEERPGTKVIIVGETPK